MKNSTVGHKNIRWYAMKRRAPNMKYLEINTTSMRLYCLSASQRRDLATARQHGCYLKYAKIMGLDKMLTGHCGTYNSSPLQAWSDPVGSRKLRFQNFMTTAQGGGKVDSLTHRAPLPPGNTPGTHFC